MEVSGHIYVRAYLTPEERPPLPVKYGAGWVTELVCNLWRQANSLSLVHPTAEVTIPTKLSSLHNSKLFGVSS